MSGVTYIGYLHRVQRHIRPMCFMWTRMTLPHRHVTRYFERRAFFGTASGTQTSSVIDNHPSRRTLCEDNNSPAACCGVAVPYRLPAVKPSYSETPRSGVRFPRGCPLPFSRGGNLVAGYAEIQAPSVTKTSPSPDALKDNPRRKK